MTLTERPLGALAAKPAAPKNDPFSGVVPDFSVFGADFTTWWQKLLAGLWGLSIVVSAAGLLIAALKYRSQKTNGYAQGTLESADDLKRWGVSAGIIVGAGVIFGGLVAVFG
jgi:hypothetical protein